MIRVAKTAVVIRERENTPKDVLLSHSPFTLPHCSKGWLRFGTDDTPRS